MSSSEYTALQKYKELKAGIETTNNDALPLPVPFGCNRPSTISTTITGHPGSTGPIGPTGAPGPTNGGVFALYAYAGNFDYTTNAGYIFSFGNSPFTNVTSYGFPINVACTLSNVGVKVLNPPPVPWTIQIYRSGNVSNSVTIATVDNAVRDKFVDNLNLVFNPGDYITIRCLAGEGGDAINVSLWFRTDGVIGPTGSTGLQGPIGPQGVTGPAGGPTGAAGLAGSTGPRGATGPAGASWAVGTLNNDIVFNAKLGAIGDVSFNSNLYLLGNAYFNNNLSIGNDLSVNRNLYVLNDTSLNRLYVSNEATFNSKIVAKQDVSFNRKLLVANDASFNSKLTVINDAFMNSKLFVSGNTTLNSNLLVAKDTILNVGLKVLGDVSFNNELFVDGKAIFQDKVVVHSDLYVLNDTSLNSTLYVERDTFINSKLLVINDTSLNSKLLVANDVSLNSKVTIADNATLNSKLSVANDVNMNSKLLVGNDVSLNSKLMVVNDVYLNSKLTVTKDTILNSKLFVIGDVSVNANLYVNKSAIIEQTLNVNDNTYLNAILMVSDNAVMNSKLIVMDNTILNSKLVVDGDALIDSTLVVTNDVSLNSKLFVKGDVSMNSKLYVYNDVYLNSKLTIGDNISLNSKLIVANDVSLNSKLSVAKDTTLNSKLTVMGDVSINANLYVNEDVLIEQTLNVDDNTYLNAMLMVYNNAVLNSKLIVMDNAILNSKLIVDGDAELDSKLIVTSDVSLNSKLYIRGDVSMDSILLVAKDTTLNSKLIVRGDVSLNTSLSVKNNVNIGTLDTCGNLIINGNILPLQANKWSLGSSEFPFKTLYVSNNTIILVGNDASGNITNSELSVDNGVMKINTNNRYDETFIVSVNNKTGIGKDSVLATATLDVSGNVLITGDVSLNSKLYVTDDVKLNSKLNVVNDVSLNRKLYAANDVSLNSKVFIRGDVSMDSILMVAKDVSLNSKVFINDDVSMNSILTVGKDVSLNRKVFIRGDVSMDSILSVGNDVSLNSKLFVVNDASFNSKITVAKDSIINGITIGRGSGNNITNTTVGYNALPINTTGQNNTTFGYLASSSIINGNHNTAIGRQALYSTISGEYNTALGSNAGQWSTNTSYNTFVGYGADITSGTFWSRSTAIGYNAKITSSNQIMMGTSAETVNVPGYLYVVKDASLNSKLFVVGDVSLGSNLIVAQDVSLNRKLFVHGDASFNNNLDISGNLRVQNYTVFNRNVDICGNLNAQYANNSIPISAFNGAIGVPLTIGTVIDTSINSTRYTDISALYFDTDAGFDITELSTGEIKVSMNSTFKYWDLSAAIPNNATNASTTGLVAQGLDTMNFVAGKNIQFELYTTGTGNDTTNYFKMTSEPDYSTTNLIAGNGLNVTGGDVSINNHLFVKGDTSFNSRVDISGDLVVKGNLSVFRHSETAIINTTINNYEVVITKDISLNGNLHIASDASINSKLYVKGDASFNSRVDICGNLYAQYPPNSIPRSAIRSEVGGNDTIVNNRNQSFYDVITQQPQIFTKDVSTYADGSSNTTKVVTVYWTYDDILAKILNTSELAFLNFDTSYKKILPNIDKIYIDVSYGNTTNGWARYNTLTIASNYNTNQYKSVTFTRKQTAPSGNASVTSVLTNLVNFDVRVYGENSAANYPTVENRALIFQQIAFKEAKPPGQPLFISSNINSYQQITLTYTFNYPELGDTTSPGVLVQTQTKYTQSDTLCSASYPLVQTISTDTETDDNVAGGSNFTVILTSLRAGTKFNFLTRIQNDLTTLYSIPDNSWNNVPYTEVPFDNNGPTLYTTLPGSSTYTSTGPSTLTYVTTTNITTSSLSNSNVIYVNIGNSGVVTPTNTSSQTFQITNPSAVNTNIVGYGKWVDNLTNLVQVKLYIDNSEKQVLSYQGFTPTETNKSGTATRSTSTTGINYFNTPSQTDIYTDTQNQGYRLYGTSQLLQITNGNVRTAIGQSRSTPYALKLEVLRDTTNVGGTASVSATSNIYVDDLSLNPSVSSTNTPIVLSVVWTMGIPSVKKYKIDCAKTYNNINSTTGFIRGDRKLATFTGVTNSSNTTDTTTFTSGTISIPQNAIQTTGTYTYNATDFSSNTTSTLQSLHYVASQTSSTTLTINETVYSLKTGDAGTANNTTVAVNHHFDKGSYNSYGSSLSTKLTLTDIHEITSSTIANLNNDIGSLGVSQYSSHTVIPLDWTLLYYSGKFQTNSTVSYPNVTSYNWNGLSGNYTYNSGTTGLDLSGGQVSSGIRYKWIVFKLNKTSNTVYTFNGVSYTIKTNEDSVKYLSIKDMLVNSGLFNSTAVSNLFNDTNTDAIGFCRATKDGTSTTVIGNLKTVFEPTAGTWLVHGTQTSGYTGSNDSKYGAKVTNNTGDFGIYIFPAALNDDLYLFIGLKI